MRLCDPKARVSSHYVVIENGSIVQLVPEVKRAWHAGMSSWNGDTDINSRSIGIEICNPGHEFGYPDFPARQIAAVITLCRSILTRNIVRPENIVAHSDVAPSRKQDPGEKFPWKRLAQSNIGLWVEPVADHRRPGAQARGHRRQGDRAAKGVDRIRLRHRCQRNLRRDNARRGYRIPAPFPPGENRRPHRRLDAGNAAKAAGRPRIRPPQKDQKRAVARGPKPPAPMTSPPPLDGRAAAPPSLAGQSAGRPLRANAERRPGRKVRAPGQTVPDNVRRGQPQGQCHREQTAAARCVSAAARVKRCGKSAPRFRQRKRHGKPHREQDRIGTAPERKLQPLSGSPSG